MFLLLFLVNLYYFKRSDVILGQIQLYYKKKKYFCVNQRCINKWHIQVWRITVWHKTRILLQCRLACTNII